MSIEDRLAALEAASSSVRSSVSELAREAIRGRRYRDTADTADLTSRLDPGGLVGLAPYRRGRQSTLPDLGTPLLARLRDDAFLPGLTAGDTDAYDGYANMLTDPVFETIAQIANPINTAYSTIGEWKVKYVLNSGTVASTRLATGVARKPWSAVGPPPPSYNVGSSANLLISLDFGTNASNMTVYVRPLIDTSIASVVVQVPSWLTASMVVWCSLLSGSIATASAYLEIVDSTDTVIASGDPEDVLNLYAIKAHSRIEAAYQDPTIATDYSLRLRIDVTKAAGVAGNVSTALGEPLLAASDSGSPPTFTPAIGAWLPGIVGYHLITQTHVTVNVPAGALTPMNISDNAMGMTFPRMPMPYAGSIMALSYRFSGSVSGGSCDIRSTIDGVASFAINGISSGASGYDTNPWGVYPFVAGDALGVSISTGGGFSPTTLELAVTLWMMVKVT